MSSNGYYNGSGLNISGAPMGQMQAHGVDAFAQRDIMQSALNRSQVLGEVQLGVAKLMDYKTETDARLKLDAIQTETETRVKRGLEAAPGSAESFFYEDGSINTAMIDDLGQEVQGKLGAITPSFIDPDRAQKFAADKDSFSGNLVTRVKGQADLHQLQNIRRASEAALSLCLQNGDYAGAVRELDRQVDAGILMPQEAQAKKIQVGRSSLMRRVSGGGGVNVGGSDFDGDSAALAMAAARDGYAYEGDDGAAGDVPAPNDAVQESGDDAGTGALKMPPYDGNVMDMTVTADARDGLGGDGQMIDATATPGEGWLTGDYSEVIATIPLRDVLDMQDSLTRDDAIYSELQPDGSTRFSCRASAGDATQRVVASANAQGGIDSDAAKAMVANIALASIYENPDATTEQIVSLFNGSGIFEALGDGDGDVGKFRVSSIVKEFSQRGKLGTTQLNLDAIRERVASYVNSPEFGGSSVNSKWDWKCMESYYMPTKEWHSDNAKAGLYRVYTKHWRQYQPKEGKMLDMDDFLDDEAVKFHSWYMNKLYAKEKKAYQDAASDWYMARIGEALINNLDVDDKGRASYGSFASDLAVVDDVLHSYYTPYSYFEAEEIRQKAQADELGRIEPLREAFRKKASHDYEALQALRQRAEAEKQERQRAEKARKQAQADAERERRDEELRRQKEEKRRVLGERLKPRSCSWEWDRKNDDTSPPCCLIPESEYKALVETMGWDGSEHVYVRINGLSIPVVGSTKGKAIRLNTSAAMKVQSGSSRRKRRDLLKSHGTLGYTFTFRNY